MLASKFSEVTILDNPRKTAAAGRNVGIRHAKGDIIAFTDGDCIVEKTGWRRLKKHLLNMSWMDWAEKLQLLHLRINMKNIGGRLPGK